MMLFASIISFLNILFVNNYYGSIAIIFVQIGVLVHYFVKRDYISYFGYYLIFLSLSFEFDVFMGTEKFYSFKNFDVLGLNLGIISLLPIFFTALFSKIKIKNIIKHNRFVVFVILFSIMALMGTLNGLIMMLVNDNQIVNNPKTIIGFIGTIYELAAYPIMVISAFLLIINKQKDKLRDLEVFFMAIFVGLSISLITSSLVGFGGVYGGVETLIVPLSAVFLPIMALKIIFEKEYRKNLVLIALMLVAFALLLKYNASGKLFISILLVAFVMLNQIFSDILFKKKFQSVLLIVILVSVFLIYFNKVLLTSTLLSSKFYQFIRSVDIFNPNWYQNLPKSPQIRVSEFLNITGEYISKPYYLFFGKGFSGTIKDIYNLFTYTEGAFSDNEWAYQTYKNMHFSLNTIFLSSGIYGVCFYIYILYITLRYKLLTNPWGIIGFLWFVVYYGYSLTITGLGLSCMLYSIINENEKFENKSNILYKRGTI